jgi:hypothetical protein
VTNYLDVFGQGDIAAAHLRPEALDNITDGLQLFLVNVMFFVLDAPESSSLEALGHDSSPSIARDVRV